MSPDLDTFVFQALNYLNPARNNPSAVANVWYIDNAVEPQFGCLRECIFGLDCVLLTHR